MASPAQPQPGGAPGQDPGAAPPQGAAQEAPNPLQIIAGITHLANILARTASPCTPDCEQVVQLMQNCAQKIMSASPSPGGGGPAPY